MTDYNKISREIRKKILKMMFDSKTSHLSSSLSCVDILTVLYFKILSLDCKNPSGEGRDRFILSKGHAAAALYATLAEKGFLPAKTLDDYCKDAKKLPGHSTRNCVPGVEASTGSLGHGLSMAAGISIAAKNDNKNYRIFVLMSDGECEEGSVWEAAMFASHHRLENLVGIIDYNKFQALGRIDDITALTPLKEKWAAFGWEVKEINGHNFSEIEQSLCKIPFKKEKPSLLLAHTVKGKGVSFIENKLEWHYKNLTEKEYQLAIKELS